MGINDDNGLEDILGAIGFASGWQAWPEEVDQRVVEEIVARIDLKLEREKNSTRANWFRIARGHAACAAECFSAGDLERFEAELREAEEHLRQGNRAHRRKVDYIVGPDGQTQRVREPP